MEPALGHSRTTSLGLIEESFVFCHASPQPSTAPDSAIPFEALKFQKKINNSSHSVSRMEFTDEMRKPRRVYYKKCDSTFPSALAQIEAAASASYRIVRGDRSALVRPVVDENERIIGTISVELPDFCPISGQNPSTEELVDGNIVEELVARYIREEDDFHAGNVGTASKLGFVGIDFDMSYYPLSSKLKGKRVISGRLTPLPEYSYPITKRDLESFPNIQDQSPCFWPTKIPPSANIPHWFKNRESFQKLAQNEQFIEQKWKAFLKELLINPSFHNQVVERHFAKTEEGQEQASALKKHIAKRYECLERKLMQCDGFRRFVARHPQIIQTIEQEFKEANRLYPPEQISALCINLENRHRQILKTCLAKDLTRTLFKFRLKLNVDETQGKQALDDYSRLIEIIQTFHESRDRFEIALNDLEAAFTVFRSPLANCPGQEHWNDLCSDVKKIIGNYKGHTQENTQGQMYESVCPKLPVEPGASSSGNTKPASLVAGKVREWILVHCPLSELAEMIKQCLAEYSPNFLLSFFRQRSPELEALEEVVSQWEKPPEDLIDVILEFFEKGEWNPGGYGLSASSNVLLSQKLIQGALENFKDRLSPNDLKNGDWMELFSWIERGKYNPLKEVKSICREMKSQSICSKPPGAEEFSPISETLQPPPASTSADTGPKPLQPFC